MTYSQQNPKRIERFKSGKDGGVDARLFITDNKEMVFQIKHYVNTGYNGLISKLKKKEIEKAQILNPNVYILVTSIPLSRNKKKEIRSLF